MEKDKFIGRLLDNRYEILEVIGTGGMAIVYKARDHRLNRLVAIKLLRDDNRQDEEFRRRFYAESQAVAMLSNPNIVSVYDVSSSPEADYIVMELIDGISLKQYMAKKGMLNWKETLHFAMQIAKALEHAHSRGIVHRDIKPHNVMVLKNGSVKVTDFGIARIMSKSNTLTKEALGSVHYISPEQAKGGRVDNRSDLYSLGVVMYEMMTGRTPYDGDSPVAVAIQHINGGAAMPSTLNPNIPGGLEQIIMKAMALDSSQRYATATEMLYDMDELRKNPSVLFDYGFGGQGSYMPPVRPARPAAPAASPINGSSDRLYREQEASRQTEEEEDEQPRSNRTGMLAIIACSAVAVIAIAIILVLWVGNSLNNNATLVRVPQLIGKAYDELPIYTDITVQLQNREYSDKYDKGEIMDQRPEAGSEVVQGADVYVVVSMGPEPEVYMMENLVDLESENAKNFLDGMGLNLKVIVREEANDTIRAGRVSRTEPTEGSELSQGQTVTLWISTGPETETALMPNVVGMDVSKALNMLDVAGFHNVGYETVDSDRAKDEVVRQSVERNKEIDVTTRIVLYLSAGPAQTTEPTTESTTEPITEPSTDPADVTATKTITLELPERTEAYTLLLLHEGQPVTDGTSIAPGTTSIHVQLTGKGVQYYEIYINGEYYATEKVDFTSNG